MSAPADPDADFTSDALLNGRLRLKQPRRGYRVNVDTVLLGAAVADVQGVIVEAGCGVGGALLVAATQCPQATFTGIERESEYAALARENVAANALRERVSILEADALSPALDLRSVDGVFFNPPYDREGEGRLPDASRRAAHVEEHSINDWIRFWSDRLSGGAYLTLIHRAQRLTEILSALDRRLGAVEIYPVFAHAGEPASRVIVRARKGARAPLRLLSGLTLHDQSGAKYTREADAILRGEARIKWGG